MFEEKLKGRTIALIGGAGFIGHNLALALKRYGADPHVIELTREATSGRGVDVCVDAVGDPRALELALRLTRKCGTVQTIGVYAERCELHMGLTRAAAPSACSAYF